MRRLLFWRQQGDILQAQTEQLYRLQALLAQTEDLQDRAWLEGLIAAQEDAVANAAEAAAAAGVTTDQPSTAADAAQDAIDANPPQLPEEWDGGEWVIDNQIGGGLLGAHAGFMEIGFQVGRLVDAVTGQDTANEEVRDWAWGLTDLPGTDTQRWTQRSAQAAIGATAGAVGLEAWAATGGETFAILWARKRTHFVYQVTVGGNPITYHWLRDRGIVDRGGLHMISVAGKPWGLQGIPILFPSSIPDTIPGVNCFTTCLRALRMGLFNR